MKRYFPKILAAALALMLLCAGALAEVRTTGNVYMRTGPGLSYSTITSYPTGSTLTYLGETSVDGRGVAWYKVSDGSHTGWMSSRYSKLVGEKSGSSSSGSSGSSESSSSEAFEGQMFPSADELIPQTPAKPGNWFADVPGEVELSNYYLADLATAAQAIGLTDSRDNQQSEVPNQYYNASVTIAGNALVEHFFVTGTGYTVCGAAVGMDVGDATDLLIAAGLVYRHGTFEHRSNEKSLYDAAGYDSCITLRYDSDNIITAIDWSSYTG